MSLRLGHGGLCIQITHIPPFSSLPLAGQLPLTVVHAGLLSMGTSYRSDRGLHLDMAILLFSYRLVKPMEYLFKAEGICILLLSNGLNCGNDLANPVFGSGRERVDLI